MKKDRLSRKRRSWNMSRIRGKDTTPEKVVRSLLHRLGYRFRLHARIPISLSSSNEERVGVRSRIPRAVSVDILLPKYKTAIFVHGCFWHRHKGCRNCTTPTHRREWWLAKLNNGNADRDKRMGDRHDFCELRNLKKTFLRAQTHQMQSRDNVIPNVWRLVT